MFDCRRGKWGLRHYDAAGQRRRKSPFPSNLQALRQACNLAKGTATGTSAPPFAITVCILHAWLGRAAPVLEAVV